MFCLFHLFVNCSSFCEFFIVTQFTFNCLKSAVFISNDLTEVVNFPTRIPECESHSPVFLDYCVDVFLSQFLLIICQNQKRDIQCHRIAYDYSQLFSSFQLLVLQP